MSGEEEQMEPVSRWEFIDELPTPETVVELLKTLPPVFGIETADYAEYVVPISQNAKVKIRQPDGRSREVYHEVWRLYMSVAGRQAMLQAAAEKNGWTVSFVPENPVNGRDAWPGIWEHGEKLVYREYVAIEKDGAALGRKPGMAHVPSTGGKGAAGSNPYEKVETSARGRAIAAWGFGVLPGSGVASLEEMYSAPVTPGAGTPEAAEPRRRLTNEEMIEQIRERMEEVRQLRGEEPDATQAKMLEYLQKSFGLAEGEVTVLADDDTKSIDWSKLKAGQLRLTLNVLDSSAQKIRAEQSPV